MSNKSTAIVAAMGIDIGKNSFHVVGLDRRGAIVLRQKRSRRAFLLERGVAVRQGLRFLLREFLATRTDVLSPRMMRVIEDLAGDWHRLGQVGALGDSGMVRFRSPRAPFRFPV